jgi:hypothetical protein
MEVTGTRTKHFTAEQEDELRHDAPTTTVLSKARSSAKVGGNEEIRGDDLCWKELKAHQHEEAGWVLAFHTGHAAIEGLHFLEVPRVETALGAHPVLATVLVAGVGSVGGMALGIHEIYEAHEKGKALASAISKDQAHVALVGTLELPAAYKAQRYAAYPEVERGDNGAAAKMMMALRANPDGVAKLQLHADRGMHAATEMLSSGQTKETFLRSNPKVAEAYAKDSAFKEGFDALVWAKGQKDPSVYETIRKGLEERDAWYGQAQVSVRV